MLDLIVAASIMFIPIPRTWSVPSDSNRCTAIIVTDITGGEWLAEDKAAVETSKKHCIKFYKRSPCVKEVTKVEVNNYHTICTQRSK